MHLVQTASPDITCSTIRLCNFTEGLFQAYAAQCPPCVLQNCNRGRTDFK